MTTLNKILFDSSIELGVDLNGIAIQTQGDVIRLLQKLEKELIAKVASGNVTDWGKARIAKQLSEANVIIRTYYTEAAELALDTTMDVAQLSATATAESLTMATGGYISSVLPTASYLETIAGNAIIQGAIQSAWWAKQEGDTAFRFAGAVRQGLVAGETNQQIVKRVRDVMDLSRRNAESLVRTSVQTVANETRDKTFAQNGDLVKGKEWVAALDNRTCLVCGSLDGKRWDLEGNPIGHSVPYKSAPAHYNCRCSFVPILKTWKEMGIDIDELPEISRASMDGQVQYKTFSDWLKRQPDGRIEATLGKRRAELYQSGKLTIDQLMRDGKPLSVKELASKYAK